MIGETGWPSEGRQRETAVPSRVNQAKFIRGFVAMAEQNGWRYNLIEAFDQPWKRISEGAVGGYWGLYDADRQDKSILAGPVSNLPHWPAWLAVSLSLFAAALLAGRASTCNPRRAAATNACGIGCWLHWPVCRADADHQPLPRRMALGRRTDCAEPDGDGLRRACYSVSKQAGDLRLFNWLHGKAAVWLLLSGFAGAVMMLALLVDARYRSFPSAALLLPALVYLLPSGERLPP